MKYYFITYQTEWKDGSGVKLRNFIATEHPLEWIKAFKRIETDSIITLVWWTELTKQECDKRY